MSAKKVQQFSIGFRAPAGPWDSPAGSSMRRYGADRGPEKPAEPRTQPGRCDRVGSDPGETLTKRQARDLTDTIKGTVSFAWELIIHAYQRQISTAIFGGEK